MPPTFVYALCFMFWLFFAVMVWVVAGLIYREELYGDGWSAVRLRFEIR